ILESGIRRIHRYTEGNHGEDAAQQKPRIIELLPGPAERKTGARKAGTKNHQINHGNKNVPHRKNGIGQPNAIFTVGDGHERLHALTCSPSGSGLEPYRSTNICSRLAARISKRESGKRADSAAIFCIHSSSLPSTTNSNSCSSSRRLRGCKARKWATASGELCSKLR